MSMLKPDYLDLDKDGNKTEPMKEAVKDRESKYMGGGMYRKKKQEGGPMNMDDQMVMVMTPPMKSDDDIDIIFPLFY